MFQIKVTISISIHRLKFSLLQPANNKFISTFLYYFGFSQLMKSNSRYVYFSWLLQFLMISKFDREQNLSNLCIKVLWKGVGLWNVLVPPASRAIYYTLLGSSSALQKKYRL